MNERVQFGGPMQYADDARHCWFSATMARYASQSGCSHKCGDNIRECLVIREPIDPSARSSGAEHGVK
jgi:hypothetical protein